MAGKLKVQNFRTNDLSRDSGKQVEFGRAWCEDFFGIGRSAHTYAVTLLFKPLSIDQIELADKTLELKFGEVTNRGDRKAYANDSSGYSQIKNFFINELHLTEANLGDYFAIYKTNLNEYFLYYVPKMLYDNFINLFRDIDVSGPVVHSMGRILPSQPRQQIYRPYLTAIKSKPFLLLAGISGTGKSRIVRELAFMSCPKYLQDKDGVTPGNYCMIEVKPNWHDSTELLGYYSNISREYQFKKFVKFLVKAKMHPEVPFFVCLDEMNLAPVEQYFAEILSILETRKHPKTDEGVDMKTIKTEVLVEPQHFKYHSYKDESGAIREKLDMTDKDWYETFCGAAMMTEEERELINRYQYSRTLQQEGLSLPDNVIIIGTVNMDETTHQFSRKVIDRAMTIEMNGGRLVDIFGGSGRLEYLPEEQQQKWQAAFRQRYVCADEVLELHPEVANDIRTKLPARLEEINKALRGTPFEVSYRVLNELTIMVGVMLDDNAEGKDIDAIISEAIDNILLMKILPRVEGDSDMFELSGMEKKKHGVEHDNRLKWLLALAPEITVTEEEGANHRQTAKGKIQEMIDRLDSHEFTRYWP